MFAMSSEKLSNVKDDGSEMTEEFIRNNIVIGKSWSGVKSFLLNNSLNFSAVQIVDKYGSIVINNDSPEVVLFNFDSNLYSWDEFWVESFTSVEIWFDENMKVKRLTFEKAASGV